jgi:pimeloyl-ACP methyl ester carboxylesterase
MGARTALEVALRVGPKVGALVLSSLPGPRARRLPWAQAFAQALEAEGLEAAGERYVWGEASRLDADGRALVRRGFLEHKAFALKHLLRRALSELRDLEEFSVELGRLEVPTLVVAGSRDEEAVSQGVLLASMLPQAEVQVIEGAGHVANLERSAEFNGIVGSFLERAA